MALIVSIGRVQRLYMERIEATLGPFELTFARFEVLRLLAFTQHGSMAMTRLGSLLQVHPTSVTSAVRRLVDQGFVERQPSPADGRVVLAAITAAGRDVVEAATDALNAQVFTQPGLNPDQVAALRGLLGELRENFGDLPAVVSANSTGANGGTNARS